MRMLYSHEVPCPQSCFLKNDTCADYGALVMRKGFHLRDSYRLTKQSIVAGMLKIEDAIRLDVSRIFAQLDLLCI